MRFCDIKSIKNKSVETILFVENSEENFYDKLNKRFLSLISIYDTSIFNKELKKVIDKLYIIRSYICQYIELLGNNNIVIFLKNLLGPSISYLGNYSLNMLVNFIILMCNTENIIKYTLDKYSKSIGLQLENRVSNTYLGQIISKENSKMRDYSKKLTELIPINDKEISKIYFDKHESMYTKSRELSLRISSIPKDKISLLQTKLRNNNQDIKESLISKDIYIHNIKENKSEIKNEEDLSNFIELLNITANNDLDEIKIDILNYIESVIRYHINIIYYSKKNNTYGMFRNKDLLVEKINVENSIKILEKIKEECYKNNLEKFYDKVIDDSKYEFSKDTTKSLENIIIPMKKFTEPVSELMKKVFSKYGIYNSSIEDSKFIMSFISTLFILLFHIENFKNNIKYLVRILEDKYREFFNLSKLPGRKPIFKPIKINLGLSGLLMLLLSNFILFSPELLKFIDIKKSYEEDYYN